MRNPEMLARVFKADADSSDLTAGGALRDDIAARYIETPIKESVMLSEVRAEPMMAKQKHLPKVIFGRVAKPGAEGVALPLADRSQLTHSEVVVSVVTIKAEVRWTDEYIEDSINSGNFENVIVNFLSRAWARDLEFFAIQGDTTSGTPLLALQDGWIKRASAVTYAHGGAVPNKTLWSEAVRAMDSEFIGDLAGMRHYTGTHVKLRYIEEVADRQTGLGDAYYVANATVTGAGVPIIGVPEFPQNLGGGTDESVALTTRPENLIIAYWPGRTRIEFDRDVSAGNNLVVSRVRVGNQIEETSAVCKSTAILAL